LRVPNQTPEVEQIAIDFSDMPCNGTKEAEWEASLYHLLPPQHIKHAHL
jgi:hypothetical protein